MPPRVTNGLIRSGTDPRHVEVLIVGSGFAGLGAAIALQRTGRTDFLVIERAGEVGGTWRDNTYPGAACDVPSQLYSFSFAPLPGWTRTYARQPEIQAYLRRTAERSGTLDRHLFGCELLAARWEATAGRWEVRTSRGDITCTILVTAFGGLCEPRLPDIPGIDTFAGRIFHSARWDHDADLAGARIAVIGTGASGVQVVPEIAPLAAHLDVYQRTAPWILPRSTRVHRPAVSAMLRRVPVSRRVLRAASYLRLEVTGLGFSYFPSLLHIAARQSLRHLHSQVTDPELRTALTPDFHIGCKRILFSSTYFPALTSSTVDLVSTPISRITATSVVTVDGTARDTDILVVATGFHATDSPAANLITGTDGRTLGQRWRTAGPQGYKGSTVSGFPNMFTLIGPNTGTGNMSMVYMIESQLNYLIDALRVMDRRGLSSVEVRPEAQQRFNVELQRRLRRTVWATGCSSWYLDRHGRNTTLWPGFALAFRRITRRFDLDAYRITVRKPGDPPNRGTS